MRINIEFFKDNFIDAIGAGVYEVEIVNSSGETKSVYIGESVFVLVRCATHLYELKMAPWYWGVHERDNKR